MVVEQFCKSILRIETEKNKALANVVMGLASQRNSKSVVELSLSPCYHYQYSSISKVVDVLSKQESGAKQEEVGKKFAYKRLGDRRSGTTI